MVETTEQIVREAPDIEAYKIGLLQSAKALADKGITIPQQQVAAMSGLQTQAAQMAQQGIGAYQPYLQEAGYTLGDAQTALGGVMANAQPYQLDAAALMRQGAAGIAPQITAAQQGMAGAQGFFDPRSINNYMNPYEAAAIDQAMQDINRAGLIQQQQLNAQAVGAGAFGGSRQGLQQAELGRNVLEQQARTAAQMRQTGYESAAQRAQQAYEQGQGRQLQAAQAAGQLGLQGQELTGRLGEGLGGLGAQYAQLGLGQGEAMGTLGLRQASLGELTQQMGQQEQGFLFDLGKQQQAQQQAELEAARQTSLQQLYEPYQRVAFLSDIYKGAPSSQQSITATTAPTVSPAQQILGLGIAGLSAAAGAQKAGLFG
jgi:hypothetical protein